MRADFFTKPLQGALFRKHLAAIMNLHPAYLQGMQKDSSTDASGPQECVGEAMSDICPDTLRQRRTSSRQPGLTPSLLLSLRRRNLPFYGISNIKCSNILVLDGTFILDKDRDNDNDKSYR